MSDDPNKRQNEGARSSEQAGQQSGEKQGQQSNQPRDISNESQKRPSQSGNEEDDCDQNAQGGQRRAS
jgi:hypothetical protein